MELKELIQHPERMDRDTLYDLRSVLALYPYFQTARLLMLQNLYLLHDTAFDEELKRAALYITDRKTIFKMVEEAHYQLAPAGSGAAAKEDRQAGETRTVELIDTFLGSIPADEAEEQKNNRRPPTPADAAVDYVAYLLATENADSRTADETPVMKGQDLIDNFLEQEQGRIMLRQLDSDSQEPEPDAADGAQDKEEGNGEEEFFTETLARIYIKQGRYQKALDIIERLSQRFPHKNAYFADQIRFLEKLIINNNKIQNKK